MDEDFTEVSFTLDELTGREKQRAMDELHTRVESSLECYPWWEDVYADFVGERKKEGIEIDTQDISFSISYSQSDFACFEGRVVFSKFYEAHPEHFSHCLALEAAAKSGMLEYAHISTNSRSEHIDGINMPDWYYTVQAEPDDTPFAGLPAEDFWNQVEPHMDGLERVVVEHLRGLCRELYNNLVKEWEYLTSEKQCIEYAEQYNVKFDEDGNAVDD